jgi:hypothetical protein
MNIDLNDKFAVKNIHFSHCEITKEELASILIPVELPEGSSWEWTTMYLDDFSELLKEYLLPHFYKRAEDDQVSFKDPIHGHVDFYPALEIAKANRDQVVEYIDGNPLNLRRDNLRLVGITGGNHSKQAQPNGIEALN